MKRRVREKMKIMRKFFLLFILLLIPLFASAAEKKVWDGWIFSGETIRVENKVFFISFGTYTDKLFVRFDSTAFTLYNDSCKKTDNLKTCFVESAYDTKRRATKARVRIYSIKPTLTVSRTINAKNLVVGREYEINVVIKNTGGRLAENITYFDDFGNEYEITEVSGAAKKGTAVEWKNKLKIGESEDFHYTIKPLSESDRSFKAKVTYTDETGKNEMFSSPIHLIAKSFLEIKTKLAKTEAYIGNPVNFTINITNRDSDDTKINYLDVIFPKGIELLEVPTKLKKVNNMYYRWTGTVSKKNDSEFFRIRLKGTLLGSSSIKILTEFENKGKTYAMKDIINSLKVKKKDILIRPIIEDGDIFESNQQKRIRLYIQNPYENVNLRNIKVKVKNDLVFIPDIFLLSLNATIQKKIVDMMFTAPVIDKNKKYPMKINVTYGTEYGDDFSKEVKRTLEVEPLEGLSISYSLSSTKIESGKELTVTVKVKNNRRTEVTGVKIYDFPPFPVKTGATSGKIDFEAKESKEIYTYTMKVPSVKEEKIFYVNTTATFSDTLNNYSFTQSKSFKVMPKEIKLTVNKKVKDSSIYKGELFYVSYVIKNPEEETVRNVHIEFPLQEKFDLITPRNYFIGNLNPGEEIYLENKELIRAKYDGSLSLDKTYLFYEDKDGNKLNSSSGTVGVKVKYSYVGGPLVVAKKSAPAQAYKNEYFNVTLKIKNIGVARADNILINDAGKIFKIITLTPNAEKTLTYKKRIARTENTSLSYAIINYPYLNRMYATRSNKAFVDIIERPVEKIKKEVKEVVEEKEKKEEIKKEKTRIERVLEFIKKILFWKRKPR